MRTTAFRWFRATPAMAAMAAALALVACADHAPVSPQPRAGPAATHVDMNQALAELRRATARYHRVEAALADGFLPAMCEPAGLVYVRPDRVDATIDPSQPEGLLYDRDADGRLTLSGVELVVPRVGGPSATPPSFVGVPLVGEGPEFWSHHIWVWRPNPDGMFARRHPEVSCTPPL